MFHNLIERIADDFKAARRMSKIRKRNLAIRREGLELGRRKRNERAKVSAACLAAGIERVNGKSVCSWN